MPETAFDYLDNQIEYLRDRIEKLECQTKQNHSLIIEVEDKMNKLETDTNINMNTIQINMEIIKDLKKQLLTFAGEE